jgi:putative FmdB family regulatory protein
MPLYEYRCPACGASRTLLRAMAERDSPVLCDGRDAPPINRHLGLDGDLIGEVEMKLQVSVPAVQFRGPGVTRGSSGFADSSNNPGRPGEGGRADPSPS